MRRSASPSRNEPPADGEAGVSEVIGFLLVFGILSIVLVLSMFTFTILHERTEENVVRLQAESVAQRVAAAAIGAALFAEQHGVTSTYEHTLDLPGELEGHAYQVRLENGPDRVLVTVAGLGIEATAPLFASATTQSFSVCAGSVPGGAIAVRFAANPSPTYCVFLEATA